MNKEDRRRLYDTFLETAGKIALYYEPNDRDNLFDELRKSVEESCRNNTLVDLTEELQDRYLRMDDPDADIQEALVKYQAEMKKVKPNIDTNMDLVRFDQIVRELKEISNATSENSANAANDDLQCTNETRSAIDPITKKRMTNPVKNIACGHTYEKESVMDLLKSNSKTKCPVIGCKNKNYIDPKDLVNDIVTKVYISKQPQ